MVVVGNAKENLGACLGRSRGSPVTRRWPGQSPAGEVPNGDDGAKLAAAEKLL
jgi:hypothetical protein